MATLRAAVVTAPEPAQPASAEVAHGLLQIIDRILQRGDLRFVARLHGRFEVVEARLHVVERALDAALPAGERRRAGERRDRGLEPVDRVAQSTRAGRGGRRRRRLRLRTPARAARRQRQRRDPECGNRHASRTSRGQHDLIPWPAVSELQPTRVRPHALGLEHPRALGGRGAGREHRRGSPTRGTARRGSDPATPRPCPCPDPVRCPSRD